MAFNQFPTSSPWPPLDLANDLNDNFSKTVEVSLSTNPADGAVLVYDASADIWTDGQETVTLDDLTNVVLDTAPTDGDILTYDASSDTWINSPAVTYSLEELDNVTISTTPTDGSALVYDASSDTWVDGEAAGGGGSTTLDGLTDVVLSTSPSDSSILVYDASSDTWVDTTAISGTTGTFSGDLTVDTDTLFVDVSTGRVGIGTSSPDTLLEIVDANPILTVRDTESDGASADSRLRLAESGASDTLGNYWDAVHRGGNLAFDYNGSEFMRIESGGNVGIGTNSPGGSLTVRGDSGNANSDSHFYFGANSDNYFTCGTSGSQIWRQDDNTERMRIDSSGNLLIGTTTTGSTHAYFESANFDRNLLKIGSSADLDTVSLIIFQNANGVVGSIQTTGSSTSYNTSSDYRLKEDLQPVVDASDRLMALRPVNFAWKSSGVRMDGFLAHEAKEVVPEAVTGEKDAVNEDGNPEYQGIDHSKIVPLLTAALQEALGRIDALESEVASLRKGG